MCKQVLSILVIYIAMLAAYVAGVYLALEYISLQQRINELELRESGIRVNIPGHFEGAALIRTLSDSKEASI
jgi:hypothetical protein